MVFDASTLWQVHGVMHTTASLSPLSKDYTLPGADVTTLTKQQDDPMEDRCSRIHAYRYNAIPVGFSGYAKCILKEIFMRLPAPIHPRAWYTFQREGYPFFSHRGRNSMPRWELRFKKKDDTYTILDNIPFSTFLRGNFITRDTFHCREKFCCEIEGWGRDSLRNYH